MWVPLASVADILRANHYLGPTKRGLVWHDAAGVVVLNTPTARNLPQDWLELTRWCILDRTPYAGSQQWARLRRALIPQGSSTLVSYSDPSVGHTGALYRACNWWWAPTWHRLRPPPSGNGGWSSGAVSAVKDRWVFPMHPDERRVGVLIAKDDAALKRYPEATYREPGGADYKAFMARAIR